MVEPALWTLPLWLLALLLVAACVLAREAGALVARRRNLRRADGDEKQGLDASSYIVTPVYGLLAFILGISFSIALDRFDRRWGLVEDEATAISTAYLRSSLLDEPYRSALQETLRQYAHTRIAPDGLWGERMEAQSKRSHALQERLWEQTYDAAYPVRETELAAYLVDATNDTLTIGTRRELARRAHILTQIVIVLLVYTVAAAGVLGYVLGDRPGSKRQATTVVFILFTMVIVTILDIDRPRTGGIQVPQRAMQELVQGLDQDAASRR